MAATEHEQRLTLCNRKLLDELNHAARRLAAAERLARLLATVAGDWNEAHDALAHWEKLK